MQNVSLTIRPSDIDAFGHVNNAVYLAYVEQAFHETLRSLPVQHALTPTCFYLLSSSLDYRRPARLGDAIAASMWLERGDEHSLLVGCEIMGDGEQTLCRTLSAWRVVEEAAEAWLSVREEIVSAFPRERGALPATFDLPADNPEFKRYLWQHQVAFFEVAANGEAHPDAMLRWMQASVFDACTQAGWTSKHRAAADFYVLQMRHDLEILIYPRVEDNLRILSRYVDSRRLRGTWLQEVYRLPGGELLLRDFSTGVFVDAQGHPSTPPPELAHDLHFGQPEQASTAQ